MRDTSTTDSTDARFRQIHLPYCLERLSDGFWLPLNRRYKPLGMATDAWVDYETTPAEARLKLTPAEVLALSIHAEGTQGRIYLYNDGCVPRPGTPHWAAYCARLEQLAKRRADHSASPVAGASPKTSGLRS